MSFEKTRNYDKYLQYRKLKHDWKVIYRNINLVDACSVDLLDAMVLGHKADYYHIACAMLQRIHIKPLRKAFAQNTNIFTFAFPKRKDHLDLSRAYASSVKDSGWVMLKYFYTPYKSISRWLLFWRQVRSLPLSFSDIAFIAARMAGYSCVIDELEKQFATIEINNKRFIPFCAPAYHEAVLTSFFRNKGVKTFCTVHGVFGRYLQLIANDIVNGENILSDYVLTFGEVQRQDLINDFEINSDKVIVAGNPKYPYHRIQIKNTFSSCLILGGIGLYDNELRQLIIEADKVAERRQIKMALKPHPLSKIEEDDIWKQIKHITLIDKSNTLTALFESGEYDFAITHNTFSYYECMIAGLKPFRWEKNENINYKGLDDRFDSAEQLEQQIKNAEEADSNALSHEAEQLLVNVIGYGINNYNQIINGTLE